MRKLTVLSTLLMAAAMLVGCAADTQVKAKDTTIAPTVEQQGEETTEVQVTPAPEADKGDKGDKHDGHDKHDSNHGR